MPNNKEYKIVVENPQSTVVAEYSAEYRTAKAYQSEADLERAFIEQLQSQIKGASKIDLISEFILGCDRIKNDDCWFRDS